MLKGKVAIVTGASRGIGREIALCLAGEGAKVVIHYGRNNESALETQRMISKNGGDSIIKQADTGKTRELERLVNEVVDEEEKIDILVNNAGICPFKDFFDITEEVWDRTLDVNLKGYFFLVQKVARHMVDKGIHGRIVNVSSISGLIGSETQVHYCSSKGGINMLTRACAVALAPHNITVNAVLPGTIKTDANVEQLADEETKSFILNNTPLKCFGEEEHVAEAVKYFVSDKAGWTTGSLLVVDGGFTA